MAMAWAGTGALLRDGRGNPEVVQLEPAGRDWRRAKRLANSASCRSATAIWDSTSPLIPMLPGRCKRPSRRSMVCARLQSSCLHTGDISHLSKPQEFDTVDQILKSARAKDGFLCYLDEHRCVER